MTRRRAISVKPDSIYSNAVLRNVPNLNTFCLDWVKFEGKYHMPVLEPCHTVPNGLFPYNERQKYKADGAIHFYLEDLKFDSVWRRANRWPHYPPVIERAGICLTPDFSLFTDYPFPTQLWNVYRGKLLGAIWQHQGIEVIPSVTWGDESTFEWCFDGLPHNSVVSVSTGHIRHWEQYGFWKGYKAMVERLNPSLVLVYGMGMKGELEAIASVKRYEHIRSTIKKRKKAEEVKQLEVCYGW